MYTQFTFRQETVKGRQLRVWVARGVLRAPRPPQLRAAATGIVSSFFRRRPQNFVGDLSVCSVPLPSLKGFLHATIFSGMESENGDPAAGFEAERNSA